MSKKLFTIPAINWQDLTVSMLAAFFAAFTIAGGTAIYNGFTTFGILMIIVGIAIGVTPIVADIDPEGDTSDNPW